MPSPHSLSHALRRARLRAVGTIATAVMRNTSAPGRSTAVAPRLAVRPSRSFCAE